jgi:hypothetical protein
MANYTDPLNINLFMFNRSIAIGTNNFEFENIFQSAGTVVIDDSKVFSMFIFTKIM